MVRKIFSKKTNKKNELARFFYNKDILVTGGCGSIGTEIVKQLIKFKPKRIRVFDNNESGLFYLQKKLNSSKIRILIGDIRDKDRLRLAVCGADIVFHAAALKHVPLCEYNPFEAVNTNVIGTQNLLEVTREEHVGKVVSISTDKAVNPINTMGATKLLSEKLVMRAHIGDKCTTKFSCVRFGNVLNSVGSVIPIFKDQIKRGGPVTITSPKMLRFFMSMPEAVSLVLKAAQISKGQEIFILKMQKIRILDLAEVLIEQFGPEFGYDPKEIKITNIGVRPGEKLDEQLVTIEEREWLLDFENLSILRPPSNLPHYKKMHVKVDTVGNIDDHKLLSKDEIRSLIQRYDL
jgi:UDP-N-acetylglucosamine 4,6-dehydratase/5-epimerase